MTTDELKLDADARHALWRAYQVLLQTKEEATAGREESEHRPPPSVDEAADQEPGAHRGA